VIKMKTYAEMKMDETVNEFLREFGTTVEELAERIAYKCIDLDSKMGGYTLVVRLFSIHPRVEMGFYRPEWGEDDYPKWERLWHEFPIRNLDSFEDRYYIGEKLPNGDFRSLDWNGEVGVYRGTLTPEQVKEELVEQLINRDGQFRTAFEQFIVEIYLWANDFWDENVIGSVTQ
jgi:hypothetical protein